MYRLNSYYLKVFLTTAETENFSETARRMYSTQSAVSKQIRRLEDELSMDLFIREGGRATLTPAGSFLYKKWKPILNQVYDAIEEAKKLDNNKPSTLNIGIIECDNVLDRSVELFTNFQNTHKGSTIQFHIDNFSQLRYKLEIGEIDAMVSITQERPLNFDLYSSIKLYEIHPVILIGRHNPLYNLEKITPTDIDGAIMCVIAKSYAGGILEDTVDLCSLHNIKPKSYVSYPNMSSLQMGLNTTEELCITYPDLINPLLAEKYNLRIVDFPGEISPRYVEFIFPNRKFLLLGPLTKYIEKLDFL